jgi:hypothetical protein
MPGFAKIAMQVISRRQRQRPSRCVNEMLRDEISEAKVSAFNHKLSRISLKSSIPSTSIFGKSIFFRMEKSLSFDTRYLELLAKAQSANLLSSGSEAIRFKLKLMSVGMTFGNSRRVNIKAHSTIDPYPHR